MTSLRLVLNHEETKAQYSGCHLQVNGVPSGHWAVGKPSEDQLWGKRTLVTKLKVNGIDSVGLITLHGDTSRSKTQSSGLLVFLSLFLYVSINLSIYLFVCLSVCLSVGLSVCLSGLSLHDKCVIVGALKEGLTFSQKLLGLTIEFP